MLSKHIQLKVKIKSLAAESKIIRREISKSKDVGLTASLQGHKMMVVRPEARHSLLAYAFLKGKSYSQVEKSARESPDWVKVVKLVEKFGQCWDWFDINSYTTLHSRQSEQNKKLLDWIEEAKEYFLKNRKIQQKDTTERA